MTQAELASAVGVTTHALGMLERGEKEPRDLTAYMLEAIHVAHERGHHGPFVQLDDETRGDFMLRLFVYAYGDDGVQRAFKAQREKRMRRR